MGLSDNLHNAANVLFLFTLDEVLDNAEQQAFFNALASDADEDESFDADEVEYLDESDDRCFTRPLTDDEIVEAVLDDMEEEGSTRLRPCFAYVMSEEEIMEEFRD